MDYRNSWSFWMHPLLTALATNPAYYYYYTAKADLFNQSVMVRRGHHRGSNKKTHSTATAHPTVSTQSFGSLGVGGGGGIDQNDSVKQRGIEACPQCHTSFDNLDYRPVQEACGHIKCRTCFIKNVHGCDQCSKEADNPLNKSGLGAATSSSRRTQEHHHDLDLMPPLLTVEEPISHRGFGSSKGTTSAQSLKELPPLLSSINSNDSAAHVKSNLKRKQSTDDRVIGPLKIQKISSAKSRSSIQQKEPDPIVVRPRSSRRSSVNSSSSSSSTRGAEIKLTASSSSSSRSSSRFFRHGEHEDKSNSSVVIAKRNSRNDVGGKKSGDGGTSVIPVNQINMPSRLVSLRSTTSKPVRLRQSSSPTSLSKRKVSRLSSYRTKDDDDDDEDNDPSFAVTISPTTLKTSKAPLVSPSKGSSAGFSRALSSSTNSSNLDLGGSSSEGSEESNSLDTDSIFLKDDWSTSNSAEDKGDKPEIKKKKKRSPVTIHEHITILSGDQPLYQCNVCMKKFKTKAHIKYHEFCQNGEKPFKCEECGQGFIAKSHYEYHLRTHTGERPYVCPKCGKGFNQRGKVTRHMRSHTGEKPFICQQCGRGFANAQALRSHFLIHTGERPFACQYCNKRFTGMTNLKKHVITHTGERPFSCSHCGKSFGLKWTLDLHLRTHSTERPFACDQCSRAFSNSKDLRRHLVIHSGERPFSCWICGTAFRRKDNLDRHIKNTHNQPKEVAKQLANEAAADYMARTKNQGAVSQGKQAKHSASGRSNQAIPGTSRSVGARTSKRVNSKRISKQIDAIPADGSPPTSPNPIGSEVTEDYVLPNGETDIPPGNLLNDTECVEPKTEVDTDCEEVNEVDGFAELRTVPMSEYHRSEGIKLLEMAKTNGDSSATDILNRQTGKARGDCTIETCEDVKPLVNPQLDTAKSRDNFGSRNLTVTVLYEENRNCQFESESTTHSAPMDQGSFTGGQTASTTTSQRRNSLKANSGCVEPKTEVVTDCEEANEVDGFAELRTVPMSEYHRSEGIKLLEMAKTGGESSHHSTENIETNQLVRPQPQPHTERPCENDEAAENINLVLKVDRSPTNYPNSVDSDVGDDDYMLPNGQTDIPSGNAMIGQRIEPKRECNTDCEDMDEPAIVITRTVSMSEYSKTAEDGSKIVEVETNGESSDKENAAEINQSDKTESHVSNGPCEKLHDGAENTDLVLKVDRSPSTSPTSMGSDIGDDYRLHNGQTDIPRGHHSSDSSEFDGFAKRRTVSMNEYHKQQGEGVNTKSNGESSDKENAERNQLANNESRQMEGETITTTCPKLHNGNDGGSHSVADAMSNNHFNELRSSTKNQSRNFSIGGSSSVVATQQQQQQLQPSVRFVYDNGEPISDDEEMCENSMRIVYACAAATAEPSGGDESGPQKVRLLYAEALGVGEPDDSGQVQLVYTSATPNQSLLRGPNQNVTLSSPKLITADTNKNAEKIQRLFAHREDHSNGRPIEIQINRNGTVMAQLMGGQPEDLSWIKSDLNSSRNLPLGGGDEHHQHDKQSPSLLFASNTQQSTFSPAARSDVTNHHNYAYPCTSSSSSNNNNMRISHTTTNNTLYDHGESDGLRTLAKAAETRRSTIEAEDAVTRAAAAIAAVGQEARNKRHQELNQRGGGGGATVPFPNFLSKKVDSIIPHQGPRKRYLSQLTDTHK